MTSIVNSVGDRDGRRLDDIPIDSIGEVIRRAGTFVRLGLHELAIEHAHHAHHRPMVEAYNNSLFVVLKTAPLEANHAV